MKKSSVLFSALLALALTLLFSQNTSATRVRSLNINELTSYSNIIIKAEVVDKKVDEDTAESGKFVTYYTLKVLDTIKGNSDIGDEIVIKQVANGSYEDGPNIIHQNFYFPEYDEGKTYVFFLPAPHHATGLLAPVGLAQGIYDVIQQNGIEILPQLKTRQSVLSKGIANNATGKQLKLMLKTISSDSSYNQFKKIIQEALH